MENKEGMGEDVTKALERICAGETYIPVLSSDVDNTHKVILSRIEVMPRKTPYEYTVYKTRMDGLGNQLIDGKESKFVSYDEAVICYYEQIQFILSLRIMTGRHDERNHI